MGVEKMRLISEEHYPDVGWYLHAAARVPMLINCTRKLPVIWRNVCFYISCGWVLRYYGLFKNVCMSSVGYGNVLRYFWGCRANQKDQGRRATAIGKVVERLVSG